MLRRQEFDELLHEGLAVVVVDNTTGVILYATPRLEAMYGLLGKSVDDLVPRGSR